MLSFRPSAPYDFRVEPFAPPANAHEGNGLVAPSSLKGAGADAELGRHLGGRQQLGPCLHPLSFGTGSQVLVIARVYRVQVAGIQWGIVGAVASCPLIRRRDTGDPRLGGVGKRGVALDEHRTPAGERGGLAGRSATCEGVQDERAWQARQLHQLHHEVERLARRVRARVAHLGEEEVLVVRTKQRIGQHDVRGPPPAVLRHEVRSLAGVVVEAAVVDAGASLAAHAQRVASSSLVAINVVLVGQSGAFDVQSGTRWACLSREEDRRERGFEAMRSRRTSRRVKPYAHVHYGEAGLLHGDRHVVIGRRRADRDEHAPRLRDAEDLVPRLLRRQNVPALAENGVRWIAHDAVKGVVGVPLEHVRSIAPDNRDGWRVRRCAPLGRHGVATKHGDPACRRRGLENVVQAVRRRSRLHYQSRRRS